MATIVAKFIRHLSSDDLRQYFLFRKIDAADLDWETGDGPLRKAPVELINALPESDRTTIFVDAEAIVELADEAGHLAMLDASGNRLALAEAFAKIDSAEGRALWLFMNDSKTFERAGLIHHCDQLREGRSWNGFSMIGLREVLVENHHDAPPLTASSIENLIRERHNRYRSTLSSTE